MALLLFELFEQHDNCNCFFFSLFLSSFCIVKSTKLIKIFSLLLYLLIFKLCSIVSINFCEQCNRVCIFHVNNLLVNNLGTVS